jgi:hypothetical protein
MKINDGILIEQITGHRASLGTGSSGEERSSTIKSSKDSWWKKTFPSLMACITLLALEGTRANLGGRRSA